MEKSQGNTFHGSSDKHRAPHALVFLFFFFNWVIPEKKIKFRGWAGRVGSSISFPDEHWNL